MTGGKLRKNRAIFEREVERARAVRDLVRIRELNRLRILYYRTAAAQRRVELEERLAALAREAVEVTDQLYNTGLADLPDRLAIENEAEVVDLDRLQARRGLVELWRELRAAVGDPALKPARLADTLETDLPRLDAAATIETILDGSPELRFADARRRAGAPRARARAGGAGAGSRGARRRWSTIASRSRRAVLRSAASGRATSGCGFRCSIATRATSRQPRPSSSAPKRSGRRVRLKIEARFAPVFADYEQEYDRVGRYRDGILARARQAYELYRARHQQMAAAYPQVLLAQRTYFEAESSYVNALGRLWESVVLLRGMLLSEEPSPGILDDAVLRRTPIEVAR